MIILGIETSCDETALALLECAGDLKYPHFKLLAEAIHSQIETHKKYGGVFPMMAKREHATNLIPLFKSLFEDAKIQKEARPKEHPYILENVRMSSILEREPELLKQFLEFIPTIKKPPIDAIAVTAGPGLEPALWVGINFAKALSLAWNIPIIPTNHMEGHIFSVLLNGKEFSISNFQFPIIALLVSGGHTQLVLMDAWLSYKVIGETRDDAVGEAFDKVARILGLPYPGGPEISRLAQRARKNNYPSVVNLPRPMLKSDNYEFSFSGLKTAVLYKTRILGALNEEQKASVAREFEDAAIEVLITKTRKAVEQFGAKTLIVGGGVIANRYLREQLGALSQELSVNLLLPTHALSTDNAVMISIAAFVHQLIDPQGSISRAPEQIEAHGTMKY